MDTKDFCCWLQGALSMTTDEDGGITFTKTQADKIKGYLVEALETETKPARPQRPRPNLNHPENARC